MRKNTNILRRKLKIKKNKPFKYPKEATPEQVGKLAENLEREFQMTGGKSIKDAEMKAAESFIRLNKIVK